MQFFGGVVFLEFISISWLVNLLPRRHEPPPRNSRPCDKGLLFPLVSLEGGTWLWLCRTTPRGWEVNPPSCGFYLRNIDPMEVLKSGYKVPKTGRQLTWLNWLRLGGGFSEYGWCMAICDVFFTQKDWLEMKWSNFTVASAVWFVMAWNDKHVRQSNKVTRPPISTIMAKVRITNIGSAIGQFLVFMLVVYSQVIPLQGGPQLVIFMGLQLP